MIEPPPDFAQDPRAILVEKLPVTRQVRFAAAAGRCQTLEGTVDYNAGDAILTGSEGEQWPVARGQFLASYEPEEGTDAGADGFYRSAVRSLYALPVAEPMRFRTPGGRGVLSAAAGDWLVQYEDGSIGVVRGDIFVITYRLARQDKPG